MSLADPFSTATVGSFTTPSWSVIQRDGVGAVRLDSANGLRLTITHSDPSVVGKNQRHYVQLSQSAAVTDPVTGRVVNLTCSASVSLSIPYTGWNASASKQVIDTLFSVITDSDFGTDKLIAYQS